jgi:hypothetical protein
MPPLPCLSLWSAAKYVLANREYFEQDDYYRSP